MRDILKSGRYKTLDTNGNRSDMTTADKLPNK